MDYNISNENSLEIMTVNEEMKYNLKIIAKWSKFFAVLGFIGTAFMILGGFAAFIIGLSKHRGLELTIGGIVYVILGVINLFPLLYLNRFADQTRDGIERNNEVILTWGISNLKSFYKFMGIMTIVIISIYILIIIGAIVGGVLHSIGRI